MTDNPDFSAAAPVDPDVSTLSPQAAAHAYLEGLIEPAPPAAAAPDPAAGEAAGTPKPGLVTVLASGTRGGTSLLIGGSCIAERIHKNAKLGG